MINQNDMLKMLMENDKRLSQTEVKEVPPLYLPWAQRVLNPFPLASSGQSWGDMGQPWAVNVLAFYVTVFVATTNNGTNFWTLNVVANPSATTIASVSTSAIAANTGVRLSDTTITQPAASDTWIELQATATLAPGAIYIFPALALLRTGN
mgnify:CR=1 FL=1